MRPFRSISDFCLGIGIIVLMVVGFIYSPRVLGGMVAFAISASILIVGIISLKRGSIGVNARTKLLVYDRRKNPFVFWFYLVMVFCIGSLGCGLIIYDVLHTLKTLSIL